MQISVNFALISSPAYLPFKFFFCVYLYSNAVGWYRYEDGGHVTCILLKFLLLFRIIWKIFVALGMLSCLVLCWFSFLIPKFVFHSYVFLFLADIDIKMALVCHIEKSHDSVFACFKNEFNNSHTFLFAFLSPLLNFLLIDCW